MASDIPKPDRAPSDQSALIKQLAQHTEAAGALVVSGIVEDWLQKLLMAAARPLSNTMAVKIFDGYGPLSQFSQKIDIACIFELIDKSTYDDLRAIKDIRNKFAHTTSYVFFTSENVARECQRLSGWSAGVDNQLHFQGRALECIKLMEESIDRRILADAVKAYVAPDA
jgi:DNA-binding MltR family transcriptional regulator